MFYAGKKTGRARLQAQALQNSIFPQLALPMRQRLYRRIDATRLMPTIAVKPTLLSLTPDLGLFGVSVAACVAPYSVTLTSAQSTPWYACGLSGVPCEGICDLPGSNRGGANAYWTACCLDPSCGLWARCRYRDRCRFDSVAALPAECVPPSASVTWCGGVSGSGHIVCTEIHCDTATYNSQSACIT